ncbi:hypothetical protein WQO_34325 (plasmid) [Streptomyces globisporus C-1027]|uniref:Uncharacterized protein n=1 Tax=Streptomyces globisporus C-1027 TaxID=1172567 RepID=A0A0U3L0V2_STRGL|nr:hypothetical protein WQO_34325 [Streptomyces globisporus C-1027]
MNIRMWLRSSATPEGDRHSNDAAGTGVVADVAILGHPGGQPPQRDDGVVALGFQVATLGRP